MRRLLLCFFIMGVAIISPAQIFNQLVSFQGSNGNTPATPLIQASDGNFYGTAPYGNPNNGGTVFKMTPDGTLSTIYSFCSLTNCTDGSTPWAPLVEATDGNFYGTTEGGGAHCCGTVFKLTPQGTLTTLFNFNFGGLDGDSPVGGLVQGTDGNFYGTTERGGADGNGTIFKITPQGTLTNLHQFSLMDGYYPDAGLLLASDGNFYGTTTRGGTGYGGTIFRITPSGTLTTIYNFGYSGGYTPYAGLIEGKDGNLYGTTQEGGVSNNGTVFKSTLDGALTTLYSFCPQTGCLDGAAPRAALVQATDGNFYGTTTAGGANQCFFGHCGTIFQITPTGALTILHSFNGADGYQPYAALVQAADESFYGTTYEGGDYGKCPFVGCGTIFRIVAYATLSVVKSGMGTVSGGNGNIYCGTQCSYNFSGGAQVTLSALPAPGYTFTGWTGCDNVNGSYCSVTMTAAKNVTATFIPANVTLTSLTFKPSYVRGGQLSAGTLTLNAPAPPGGVTVALNSDHPGVAHPPSFAFVPGGKSSVGFAVNTFPVKSNTTVTITATAGSSHVSGTLTVGITALPALN